MPRQIAVAVLLVLLAAPTPSTAAPPTSWSAWPPRAARPSRVKCW